MKIYSHVKKDDNGNIIGSKELLHHLQEVAEGVDQCPPLPSHEDDVWIRQLGRWIAYGHDFGKSTSFFQDYLLTGKKRGELYFHSFISALWTAYIIDKGSDEKDKLGWKKYSGLMGYLVTHYHHSDLGAMEEDIVSEDVFDPFLSMITTDRVGKERIERCIKQVEDLKKKDTLIEGMYQVLLNFQVRIDDFGKDLEGLVRRLNRLKEEYFEEDEEIKNQCFIYLQLLYSLLIDGDKHSAAGVPFVERRFIPGNLVKEYVNVHFKQSQPSSNILDYIRTDFFNTANERLSEFNVEQKIYTITSPTGSGKTLTSLSVALGMREIIYKEKNYYPRIIYSLPFTSIIEQNHDVFERVLKQLEDFHEFSSAYLLKHHHLADIKYRENNRDKSLEDAILLMESWESEIVVTTFYQLLHTLIGFKNSYLKKLHQICGSIILLDEVQNIPAEYWPLLEKIFEIISRYLGCYIVLMTATKPLIFSRGQAVEWIPKEKINKYYSSLNRTKIIRCYPKNKEDHFYSIEEWKEEFDNIYREDQSFLLLLNTVSSSIEIYHYLVKEKNLKCPIFYLSTNITPRERKERIDKVNELLKKREPLILVSTQVVEAGVDMDFDVVVRDIAPIDSIVQAAGRGNRNFKRNTALVYIIPLRRKKSSDSTLVYGDIHTNIALELVANEIEEKDYYSWIENFYQKKIEKVNKEASEGIYEAINSLRFHLKERLNKSLMTVSDFQLIKQRTDMCNCFIELKNDEDENSAGKIWSIFEETVLQEHDPLRRKKAFYKIRREFQSYVISIPLNKAKKYPYYEKGGIFKPTSSLEFYYEVDGIGFKREERDDDVWLI